MRYAETKYVKTGHEDYLEMRCPDGTVRGVVFRDARCQAAALIDGRAGIDWTAIVKGMLPRGASLVSRAGSREVSELLQEQGEDGFSSADPLAAVRLRFSLGLLVRSSEYIDEKRDAEARVRDREGARIYEGIVDELEKGT